MEKKSLLRLLSKTLYNTKEALKNQGFFLMRKMGLEPTQPESYKILSLQKCTPHNTIASITFDKSRYFLHTLYALS